MTKVRIRRIVHGSMGFMWRVEHAFCVGVRDTLIYCKSHDDALSYAIKHAKWHRERVGVSTP